VKLIKIFRDHGLRAELTSCMGYELAFQGRDMRGWHRADHMTSQKQAGLVAVGLCVPTGRVNPERLDELARLSDVYGNSAIRLTIGQNAIIPNVPADRVTKLRNEPLLKQFSPRPSPFMRGLVACVGTDYCNLALIETKSRAVALSQALHEKMGAGAKPLTIHWSGCPAGCGNHEVADFGLRGFKTKIDGKLVDAVAVYASGRTGAHAVAGKEILATVPCDESFPDVIANVILSSHAENEHEHRAPASDPLFTAAATVGLASWRSAGSFAPSAGAG
jgi:ferredoxin-nitrite reductase